MEPETSWEFAFQEWSCERGTDSSEVSGERGACVHPRGRIMPGDEFLLVYPGLSAEAAAHIAQRVMPLFQQRAKTLSIRPGLSLSAGIASIRLHAPSDARELLSMADEALYHSKRAGKGVSTVFQASGRVLSLP